MSITGKGYVSDQVEVKNMKKVFFIIMMISLAAFAHAQGGTQRVVLAELFTGTW
jgi:hypothetical protein